MAGECNPCQMADVNIKWLKDEEGPDKTKVRFYAVYCDRCQKLHEVKTVMVSPKL